MKRALLMLLVLTAMANGQQNPGSEAPTATNAQLTSQIVERNAPMNQSDLYCAGFLSPELMPRDHWVAGGSDTPGQTRFRTHDFIFLRGGFTPGTRVAVVRMSRDLNEYSPFPALRGQKALKSAGHVYANVAYATVLENRGENTAVAQLDFSCEDVMPGDLALPFEAVPAVNIRATSTMDRFPAEPARFTGLIVAARDFDQFVSTGRKIYLNIGQQKGLKPGDYLRIVRDYEPKSLDVTSSPQYDETLYDDTQKNPIKLPKAKLKELPRRVVGEIVILKARETTATAMVTFALEPVHLGDRVEPED